MLKCIRINLYKKKKLKYNLKLFKFRKSSQVLFCGQEWSTDVIRGLWVTSQRGAGRKEKVAAMVPSPV